jgi:hypothetical protein
MALPAMISSTAPAYSPLYMAHEASRFSAQEIREAIAYWVSQDRLDLADALVAAGLSQYSESEDILALAALVAEVQQDWAQAQDRLETLARVQDKGVTADTLYHLIRVLRCRNAYFKAYLKAREAVQWHPDHPGLNKAFTELQALMESVSLSVTEEPTAR